MSIPSIAGPWGEIAKRGSGCGVFEITTTSRPVTAAEVTDGSIVISKRWAGAGAGCRRRTAPAKEHATNRFIGASDEFRGEVNKKTKQTTHADLIAVLFPDYTIHFL